LLLGPFEGFTLTGSYGQGIRSIDPSYITQDVQTPFAHIAAYEGGIAYAGALRDASIVARSVFFETLVDKDLIFDENAGRNVLGVGTHRTGWIGAVRATAGWFDESANLTLVRATYDDTHLLVAYIPGVVLRSDSSLVHELPLHVLGKPVTGTAGVGVTYVGPRPLPYGQRSDDIFTIDASLTFAWSHYQLGIICTNLLDAQYRLGEYNYASDFHSQPQPTLVPERMFAAGAPRGVFGTFAVNFGGT
jgi:hypothetical protein